MDICFFDETRSFPEEKGGGSPWLGESLSLESFQSITERVHDTVRVLQDLTPEEQKEVLNCFTKCLRSDEELQDLERRVSEVQCSGELQMNNAVNSLISSLFSAAGVLIEARAETIWDILDALKELSEVRQFVAEALDEGTLPLMKDKVEPVLEENWGEGPLDVSYDPEARTACALYVVVSILLQLGEKPSLRLPKHSPHQPECSPPQSVLIIPNPNHQNDVFKTSCYSLIHPIHYDNVQKSVRL